MGAETGGKSVADIVVGLKFEMGDIKRQFDKKMSKLKQDIARTNANKSITKQDTRKKRIDAANLKMADLRVKKTKDLANIQEKLDKVQIKSKEKLKVASKDMKDQQKGEAFARKVSTLEARKQTNFFNKLMRSNNLLNKKGLIPVRHGFNNLNRVMKTNKNLIEQQGQHVARMTKPFAGYALSIMFAGMALSRLFNSIIKFGTKAFKEVSHSVEGTVTNTDKLEGSMKFLGFTIGQALEPIVAWIIPIVDAVSDWTEANPKLTSTIVAVGAALGAIFMVGGMGVLAFLGFQTLGNIMSGGFAASAGTAGVAVGGLGSKLGGIAKMLAPGSALMIALGVGLAIGVALWINNKEGPFSVGDWLTALGLGAASGFMIGGPLGALVGFIIAAILVVSKESIRMALKQVELFKTAKDKLMRGEILTAEEAYKIHFQGTIMPDEARRAMDQEFRDAFSRLRGFKTDEEMLQFDFDEIKKGFQASFAKDQDFGISQMIFNDAVINVNANDPEEFLDILQNNVTNSTS